MTEAQAPILLDTCAAIWITSDQPIAQPAAEALDQAFATNRPTFASPMTAWEIGMLAARGRASILLRPQVWFQRLLDVPGVRLAAMSIDILILSSFLPGAPPRDPTDRIIATTARELGYRVMTRDRGLLAYAAQGHIQAIAC